MDFSQPSSFHGKNCISLHTKQGPIRPNLHHAIYWCRFTFVGGKAEAFSLIPTLQGWREEGGEDEGETGGGLADRSSLNHIHSYISTYSG